MRKENFFKYDEEKEYPDGIDRSGEGKLVLTQLGKMRRKLKPRMLRLPDSRIFIEDKDIITDWQTVQKAFDKKELNPNDYIWDDTPWRIEQAKIKFKKDHIRAQTWLKATGKLPPDDAHDETYDEYKKRMERLAYKLQKKRR